MRYFCNKDYVLRTIAGESVLVSIRSGVADFSGIINLNPSAVLLWTCLQNGAEISNLVQAFTEKFEVSAEQAEIDIREMLAMLEQRKMVTHE